MTESRPQSPDPCRWPRSSLARRPGLASSQDSTRSARAGLPESTEELHEDVLICGDDPDAKVAVEALGAQVVTGRVVDAGPLEVARWLETLTAVLLNINRRYKAHTGITITDLP